ncbi:hypothetical protein K3495_g3647 [Podosphaera aphanis]|nr:hypothetical protein K3495_g3647 [Podosphaera aphanis]
MSPCVLDPATWEKVLTSPEALVEIAVAAEFCSLKNVSAFYIISSQVSSRPDIEKMQTGVEEKGHVRILPNSFGVHDSPSRELRQTIATELKQHALNVVSTLSLGRVLRHSNQRACSGCTRPTAISKKRWYEPTPVKRPSASTSVPHPPENDTDAPPHTAHRTEHDSTSPQRRAPGRCSRSRPSTPRPDQDTQPDRAPRSSFTGDGTYGWSP